MRLTKDMIQHISEAIATNLVSKHVATMNTARPELVARIAETITADLLAEDKLNKEVEKLLSAHEAEISRGGMDYRKVFELTKQKLAKERGIVL
ncbi:MAG: DUF507 family protein [Nitrospirota bacterium]|nr:DUF507 family protein [Nitrospirota bacterium]